MNTSKHIFLILMALVLLVAGGVLYFLRDYHVVDFRLYPKDALSMDLRGEDITPSHFDRLQKKLPHCYILWNVPFQGAVYPSDSRALTVSSLSGADLEALDYFPGLQELNAEDCRDYENLAALQALRPELKIHYLVELDGVLCTPATTDLYLTSVTGEILQNLPYLPQLKSVTAGGVWCEDYTRLQEYCREHSLEFLVDIDGMALTQETRSLSLDRISGDGLSLLRLLPELKMLYLTEPEAAPEDLIAFSQTLPEVTVTWEKSILGQRFSSDAKVIDLTEVLSADTPGQTVTPYDRAKAMPFQGDPDEKYSFVRVNGFHPLPDKSSDTRQLLEELEEALPYFPEVEEVLLLGCWLDNEALAAFRETHRADYKVVWLVQCDSLAVRTDTTYFMPIKYHVYYFFDSGCVNLKYCEDMVCIDIGHMLVKNISFVESMPNLKYLILAHTGVRDITPLSTCKNLVFLEMDWTSIQDLTPLLGCTALEDLNVGMSSYSLEPLKQMTWLKNLWMNFREEDAWAMRQALPDTFVMSGASATVAGGWRRLPNYYAMRDELKMFYMKWA